MRNVLKKLAKPEKTEDNDNIFVIPNGNNFEGYISSADYESVLIDVVVDATARNDKHKAALKKQWFERIDKLEALAQELRSSKAQYARLVAEAISNLEDDNLRIPMLVRSLFDRISKALEL